VGPTFRFLEIFTRCQSIYFHPERCLRADLKSKVQLLKYGMFPLLVEIVWTFGPYVQILHDVLHDFHPSSIQEMLQGRFGGSRIILEKALLKFRLVGLFGCIRSKSKPNVHIKLLFLVVFCVGPTHVHPLRCPLGVMLGPNYW